MNTSHDFDLVPRVGIGPLRLGMTLAEADAAVGGLPGAKARTSLNSVYYFFDAALQFELGRSGRVQFIGLSQHALIACRYHGQDVFDIAAPDLFALIAANDGGEHHYRSGEYSSPNRS